MSADVWLSRDIRNALAAAWVAQYKTNRGKEYLEGYLAALRTLGLFFGVPVSFNDEDHPRQLDSGGYR